MVEGLGRLLAVFIPAYMTLGGMLDIPFAIVARSSTKDLRKRFEGYKLEGWKPQDIAVVASVHSKLKVWSVGILSYLANRARKKTLDDYSFNLLTVRESL